MKELNSMTAGSKETGFKLNTEKFLEKGIVKLNNKNCIEKESFMGGGTVWVEVTGRGENCDNVIGASGQFSCSVVSDSLQPHGLQHARVPCSSPSPRVCLNSCPLCKWCYLDISSSVTLFSSCLQHFPASGSFPRSWLFTSGGQSIGALASVLPVNIQGWFPLGWTGWISLQSKGLSRVFSSTAIQKYQFFSAQASLYSSSHILTRLLEKP